MATITRKGTITFEEFCILIKPKQKADLIDGVIYMASPENLRSNRLCRWLCRILEEYVEDQDLGEIFSSRVAFRMGEEDGPEPDIAFVAKERLHLLRNTFVAGAPDLAIEIVSPESVDRDYVKKRALYAREGVREYWIIDEDIERVTLLRLDRDGQYREARPSKGVLRSRVVKGFWLRTEWLWQSPRPAPSAILAQLRS